MENNKKEQEEPASSEGLPVPPYNNEMHSQWEQRYKTKILLNQKKTS